jgi:hypothetical protein
MKWIALIPLLATLAAPVSPAAQQPPQGTAGAASSAEERPLDTHVTVTPERVRLGEPFVYEIAVTHPGERRYDLRLPSELGAFGALGMERHREDGPNQAITTFRLKLALYELGKHRLPDLTFDVAGTGGEARFHASGPEVEGLSSLATNDPEARKLLDIRGPVGFDVRSYRVLAWLAGLAALASLAIVGARRLWALRERARPRLPLEQRAREALEQLAAKNLPGTGRAREFYFALSDIVRGYVGERYGVEALECTSTELLDRLRRRDTPGLPFPDFTRFLREADLVKFARAPAEPDECNGALAFAARLVELTTPSPAGGAADARPAVS